MVYLHPQLAALFLLTVAVALPQLYNQDPSDWIEPDQPNGEDQYVTDVAFAPPIQIAPTDAVNPNIMDGTNHALDSIVPDDTFNLDGPTYSANLFASLPADPIASTSDHCLPYKQELCCKGKVITLPEDDVDGKIQIGDCHKYVAANLHEYCTDQKLIYCCRDMRMEADELIGFHCKLLHSEA